MAGGQRCVEQRVCFLEAMEPLREPRTDVQRAGSIRRRCNSLLGGSFGAVMVRDTTEQVAAEKQQLRQRHEVFERRTFDTAQLQSFDRRGKIGEGNSTARIAPGRVHDHACYDITRSFRARERIEVGDIHGWIADHRGPPLKWSDMIVYLAALTACAGAPN